MNSCDHAGDYNKGDSMKLPLKTRSMKFMLFIAISSLFLSSVSAMGVDIFGNYPANPLTRPFADLEDLSAAEHILRDRENIEQPEKNYEGESIFGQIFNLIFLSTEEQLIRASKYGDINRVKQLLEHEDIDVSTKVTALMWASYNGLTRIVELFLKQENIDVNTEDRYGVTALMLASGGGHVDIVELLLEYENIDVNAKNKEGGTALGWAYAEGHTRIVELLLKQENIDANARSSVGGLLRVFPPPNLGGGGGGGLLQLKPILM